MDVGALCGTYEMIPLESMRIKIVGCLGPIAMRLGDIETNKASYTISIKKRENSEKERGSSLN